MVGVDSALRRPDATAGFFKIILYRHFFAVENATTDAAIWGINGFMLADAAGAKLGFTTFGSEKMVIRANAARVEKLLRKARPPASVLDVEPERQNERLSIQQGLFVMPCNLDRPFEANLGATFRFRRHLIQNQQPEPWSLKISPWYGREIDSLFLKSFSHGNASSMPFMT